MSHSTKPTLLDYAILGLIREEPLSGYEIRKVFETTALGNYSSSPGTIYPALKRLQRLQLVEKRVQQETGKAKVEITSEGREHLRGWLLRPLEESDIEKRVDELLLRFAFMAPLISSAKQISFLTTFRDLLYPYITALKDYHRRTSEQLPASGRLAFEHGIMSYQATLEWCEKALQELTKNKSS